MPAYAITELMYILGTCIGLSLMLVTLYFIWESAKDYSRPLKEARNCCSSCQSKYNWLHFRYKVLEAKARLAEGWDKNTKEDEE